MELRNAKYNQYGTIDCEIDHPVFGWIPFTASPNDSEEIGRTIYATALEGDVEEYISPPDPEPMVPDRITARQFKMQLELSGLTSTVEDWVAQQTKLIQIAYENSSTFVRTEPMMQAGFTALGFTEEEGDAFFLSASQL